MKPIFKCECGREHDLAKLWGSYQQRAYRERVGEEKYIAGRKFARSKGTKKADNFKK